MPLPTEFLPDPLPADPLRVAAGWLAEAWALRAQPNPDAMVLATVDAGGQPSARVVLCKGIVVDPGYVRFYTNYLSRKGREIEGNPRAAVVMHWDAMHRQVRIEGRLVKAPAAESDAYFASRPWQRRVGAWASAQSEPVLNRAELVAHVASAAGRLGVPVPGPEQDDDPGVHIPRPPHWGGYHLWVEAAELWVEGESRIHDRARYTRPLSAETSTKMSAGTVTGTAAPFSPGAWRATRLQP